MDSDNVGPSLLEGDNCPTVIKVAGVTLEVQYRLENNGVHIAGVQFGGLDGKLTHGDNVKPDDLIWLEKAGEDPKAAYDALGSTLRQQYER